MIKWIRFEIVRRIERITFFNSFTLLLIGKLRTLNKKHS